MNRILKEQHVECWLFKIDKPLAKLIKRKRRNTQKLEIKKEWLPHSRKNKIQRIIGVYLKTYVKKKKENKLLSG